MTDYERGYHQGKADAMKDAGFSGKVQRHCF